MNLGHLDESAGDPGVWRVRSRVPPHNAYTDTAADRVFWSKWVASRVAVGVRSCSMLGAARGRSWPSR